jgi:hypothetical protein
MVGSSNYGSSSHGSSSPWNSGPVELEKYAILEPFFLNIFTAVLTKNTDLSIVKYCRITALIHIDRLMDYRT